jgi:hypothetical protein
MPKDVTIRIGSALVTTIYHNGDLHNIFNAPMHQHLTPEVIRSMCTKLSTHAPQTMLML